MAEGILIDTAGTDCCCVPDLCNPLCTGTYQVFGDIDMPEIPGVSDGCTGSFNTIVRSVQHNLPFCFFDNSHLVSFGIGAGSLCEIGLTCTNPYVFIGCCGVPPGANVGVAWTVPAQAPLCEPPQEPCEWQNSAVGFAAQFDADGCPLTTLDLPLFGQANGFFRCWEGTDFTHPNTTGTLSVIVL